MLGQVLRQPLQALGVRVGDDVEFGSGQLRIAGVLQSEPDAAGELLQMAPTLLVGREEVEAAGLAYYGIGRGRSVRTATRSVA